MPICGKKGTIMMNSNFFRKTAVILSAVTLLTGCGTKTAPSAETQVSEVQEKAQETKTVNEIYQEITEQVSLESPACMKDDFISNYYGIDVSTLEEYVFSMSEDATQAETVVLMKAKDGADTGEIVSTLETVVDEKKNEMENYLPEQFEIVEKSEVKTRDRYVWLVISQQADAITDIIEKDLF